MVEGKEDLLSSAVRPKAYCLLTLSKTPIVKRLTLRGKDLYNGGLITISLPFYQIQRGGSKKSFQICIIDERGEIMEEFSIDKSPQGFSTFLQKVRKFKEIEFSIETNDSPIIDLLLSLQSEEERREEALSCSEVFREHMGKDIIHPLEEGREIRP